VTPRKLMEQSIIDSLPPENRKLACEYGYFAYALAVSAVGDDPGLLAAKLEADRKTKQQRMLGGRH